MSRFASITPNIVVRKGEAPRLVSVTPAPIVSQVRGLDRPELPVRVSVVAAKPAENESVLSPTLVEESYGRWRSTHGKDFVSAGKPSGRPKAHKLFMALTDAEYEALAVIAAKSGLTRHQVVRSAVDGFFKWLGDEPDVLTNGAVRPTSPSQRAPRSSIQA